jgi:hypothetical protein
LILETLRVAWRAGRRELVVSIRGSPKRGTAIEVFDKLIAFPLRLTHPNLTVEVVLVREDHIRLPGR